MDPENVYFLDYYERTGDKYANLGHLKFVGNIPEGRELGAPGIREEVLKSPLLLDKSYGVNSVVASPSKPRQVWTMVTIWEPIPLPFFVHPQTHPNDIELEVKKVGVRYCMANGCPDCSLDNLLEVPAQRILYQKIIRTLLGRGELLDATIKRVLETLS